MNKQDFIGKEGKDVNLLYQLKELKKLAQFKNRVF